MNPSQIQDESNRNDIEKIDLREDALKIEAYDTLSVQADESPETRRINQYPRETEESKISDKEIPRFGQSDDPNQRMNEIKLTHQNDLNSDGQINPSGNK